MTLLFLLPFFSLFWLLLLFPEGCGKGNTRDETEGKPRLEAAMNTEQNKARKTGIIGGTFDPPHNAHLAIAEAARIQYGLDRVLMMPSGHSYFKDHQKRQVTPAPIRLKMTELACMEYPYITASDLEVRREGNTYTCETLQQLAALYPDDCLYFIVGADTIAAMDTWYHPQQVFDNAVILAAVREDQVDPDRLKRDIRMLEEKYGARIGLISIPTMDISSTEIKDRIEKGESIEGMLPEAVRAYICDPETSPYLASH
jgi:nicotinate-nucleotide adenylyltransferase